jgi:hypothetical protein
MIQTANTIASTPHLRAPANAPRYFGTLALTAGMCLSDVRRETHDSLPARIPMNFRLLACRQVRPYLKSAALKEAFYDSTNKQITQPCAGVK